MLLELFEVFELPELFKPLALRGVLARGRAAAEFFVRLGGDGRGCCRPRLVVEDAQDWRGWHMPSKGLIAQMVRAYGQ